MSNISRRRNCRRRLAALTFLSNISLDGTHRDTPLGVLNLNLQHTKPHTRSSTEKKQSEENEDRFKHCINYSRRLTISECTADLHSKRKDPWFSSDDKIGSVCTDTRVRSFSRSKERVQKFVTDTKAKLYTLSQKRKHLVHQKSTFESLVLPSGLSTESLTYVSHSRKPSMTFDPPLCRDTQEFRRPRSLKDHVKNERLVLLSSRKVPFAVFSLVPFHRHSFSSTKGDPKPEGIRRRHNSSIRQLSILSDGPNPLDLLALLGIEQPEDGQDISFGHFLTSTNVPKRCRSYGPDVEHQTNLPHNIHASGCVSFDQAVTVRTCLNDLQTGVPSAAAAEKINLEQEVTVQCRHPCHTSSFTYNPNLLDDPDLIAGKHSTLLAFPSYVTSIINYVKPSDLKKDLNDKFKEKFPHLRLTLSKLRSLKKEMLFIARHECNTDLSIVAQAFVYFEKLILKMLVNKQNRKLCAGACLMLAAKLNDIKGPDLQNLLEKIEAVFRVNRKDLIFLEFRVLVALEFSLHLSLWEVLPHYQRLVYTS